MDLLGQSSKSSSGANSSVFAPQGDLGAIDDKYDVAISSSCGALDHIVVDTIDTAQACVNFLKAGGIGVATFIALDKVGKKKSFYC